MKKLAAFLLTIIFCANFLTGCGGFGVGDSLEISGVSAVYDEKTGVTTVTIRYLDDIEEPLVFEIPKGAQGDVGQTGNGIREVKTMPGDEKGTTKLLIYFTDGSDPVSVILKDGVDGKDGEDGISISGIRTVEELPDGSVRIAFVDSNGNDIGEPILIPAGEDGSKITDITADTETEDGSVVVKVSYNDGEPKEFTIPAGKGVSDIQSTYDVNTHEYKIIFTYTDDTTVDFTFRPTAWLSGYGDPLPTLGIVGDYYFDKTLKIIHLKVEENKWEVIANLEKEKNTYKVTFAISAGMNYTGPLQIYEIKEGESFAVKVSEYGNIPIPTKTGYTFVGWYTVENPDLLTVNHGRFTDLTPIFGDMTLYAHWEKNAE
ncbi:MAG: InlB B-repeat-containing protein [Clostridia bacterium]|nr:InlB B-repeat-containing protein [Clostridia bacterium]